VRLAITVQVKAYHRASNFRLFVHLKNLYTEIMKDDPVIADVRKAREDISKRFGGDISKIYAYFKEEEQKLGDRYKVVKPPQKRVNPSKQ
jgi:hypothetical protein